MLLSALLIHRLHTCRKLHLNQPSSCSEGLYHFLRHDKTPAAAAACFSRTSHQCKVWPELTCVSVCVSGCPATPCCVTLRWLTAAVCLYNSWSLLCVWLYKHRVGWLPHAELQYWSLRRDPTASLIVLCPFLFHQSIALCVDFYPLTNHSAPLPLLSCQSSGSYCLIWSSFWLEFHILSGKSKTIIKYQELSDTDGYIGVSIIN